MNLSALKGPWEIERMVDDHMAVVSESALVFVAGVKAYLEDGADARFAERLAQISEMESKADELRRKILTEIYSQTLIPDARADVMSLLNELDNIVNGFEAVLHRFDDERPAMPEGLHRGFTEVAEHSANAVESLIAATRAFVRNPRLVEDEGHKVLFYEKEADVAVGKLRKAIFTLDVELALKMQLAQFADALVWTSDQAEDVFDDLRIFALKRAL